MTDATAEAAEEDAPKKKSKLPLLIGVVLALAGGGGGFFLTSGGLGGGHAPETDTHALHDTNVSFVPVPPLVATIGHRQKDRHLRFSAQLEVIPGKEDDVLDLMPRVTDVLNGYLRAINITDIEDPSALVRIRAQMLRRVQIVVGGGVVKDLLVTEFVLS